MSANARPVQLFEKQAKGRETLSTMDRHLSSRAFMVGDAYSVAEIALYAYTHVAHEGGFGLSGYPAIRGWLGRVERQPGHVPITD